MISVIIPAYNAAETLQLCLSGFAQQTFKDDSFEVILVDDGSTDQTAKIAQEFPLKYIYQNNQGPAAARNNGVAACKGDIILFTDADCIPTPEWIEEMVSPLRQKDVMAVKGAYRTNQKEIVARFAQIEFEERFALLEKAGETDMVDTYSAAFRRHIFDELKGFDTRFPVANNEDTDLSYRISAKQWKMVFNPHAIVYHLNHPSSLIRYATLKFSRGYWRMAVYKRFPKKMIHDTYTPKSLKLQIIALTLVLAAIPLSFSLPTLGVKLLLLTACIFAGTILPFLYFCIKKDFMVALFSPFLLTVRAAAIGSGALYGCWQARLK